MITCRVTSRHARNNWSGLGIFLRGFLFSSSFPIIINFFFDQFRHVHIFAIISNLLFCFCFCLYSFFLFFFCFFVFSVFVLYQFHRSERGIHWQNIEFTFHVIQPIPSAPAAAQDEMKGPRAFKLTVTVIDR